MRLQQAQRAAGCDENCEIVFSSADDERFQFTAEKDAILDLSKEILTLFESDNETEIETIQAKGESEPMFSST